MNEIFLLYQIGSRERVQKITKICKIRKIQVKEVQKESYERPIFQLLGNQKLNPAERYQGDAFEDEMLVMAVDYNKLDDLLAAMKQEGIHIPYKAVVTAENGWWTSLQLYEELKREHLEMQKRS